MKKIASLLMVFALIVLGTSCKDNNDDTYRTYDVNLSLNYDNTPGFSARADVKVTLTDKASGYKYTGTTDSRGSSTVTVPAGLYTASASDVRLSENLNSMGKEVQVTSKWNSEEEVSIEMTYAGKRSNLVIKEVYFGGCPDNTGAKVFAHDQYVILYNNSEETLELGNVCFAMGQPYNSNASNADYVNGSLFYENLGWIPAGTGLWYFTDNPKLEPGEQLVVALRNALDNTLVYTNSINFDNSAYYCMYDPETFTNTSYYKIPAASISSSHYIKAYHFGQGNAWAFSQTGPAFFIFDTGGKLESFVANPDNVNYYNNNQTKPNERRKIPTDWIIDGVEVFNETAATNNKRLTANVDGGHVKGTGKLGYSVYRNVDKQATEAIASNEGKLVYNYSLGIGTTDPSGIDAEASIANGARIIYKDTNNSTNDFHQRSKASLRK